MTTNLDRYRAEAAPKVAPISSLRNIPRKNYDASLVCRDIFIQSWRSRWKSKWAIHQKQCLDTVVFRNRKDHTFKLHLKTALTQQTESFPKSWVAHGSRKSSTPQIDNSRPQSPGQAGTVTLFIKSPLYIPLESKYIPREFLYPIEPGYVLLVLLEPLHPCTTLVSPNPI